MTESNTSEEHVQPTDAADETPELQEEELSEVDQLKKELLDANDAKLRALADFKNFQKRSFENENRASSGAMAKVVRSILPSIEHCGWKTTYDGQRDGGAGRLCGRADL